MRSRGRSRSRGALRVGNDVVDLGRRRTSAKSLDARFLARIFTDAERARIQDSPTPDLEIWKHWAIKEAAFKSVVKTLAAAPVFRHSSYAVSWIGPTGDFPNARGEEGSLAVVEYGRLILHALVTVAAAGRGSEPGFVHAVCLSTAREGCLESPHLRFDVERIVRDPRTAENSQNRPSGRERLSFAVRDAALPALARTLSVPQSSVSISRTPRNYTRAPPVVLLDGRRAPIDISLSHDGSWVAWAFLDLRPAYHGGR